MERAHPFARSGDASVPQRTTRRHRFQEAARYSAPVRRSVLVLSLLLGVAAAFGLSACGGDDEPERAATVLPEAQTTTATTPTTTATAPTTTVVPPTTATTTATTTTPSGGAPATTTQPSGGAPATTPTTTQPAAGTPSGCPGAVGGFIRDVRASGTDCTVAGQVASAWFDAIDGGSAPDAPITAVGYACSGTLNGQIASVACVGDGGRVTFTASP